MKVCKICGKGTMIVGHRIKLRGHYNPTGKKRKYPNLQKFTTPEGKKVLACTECIKRLSKRLSKLSKVKA